MRVDVIGWERERERERGCEVGPPASSIASLFKDFQVDNSGIFKLAALDAKIKINLKDWKERTKNTNIDLKRKRPKSLGKI